MVFGLRGKEVSMFGCLQLEAHLILLDISGDNLSTF